MGKARRRARFVDVEAQLGKRANHSGATRKAFDGRCRRTGDREQSELRSVELDLGKKVAIAIDHVAPDAVFIVVGLFGRDPTQGNSELDQGRLVALKRPLPALRILSSIGSKLVHLADFAQRHRPPRIQQQRQQVQQSFGSCGTHPKPSR